MPVLYRSFPHSNPSAGHVSSSLSPSSTAGGQPMPVLGLTTIQGYHTNPAQPSPCQCSLRHKACTVQPPTPSLWPHTTNNPQNLQATCAKSHKKENRLTISAPLNPAGQPAEEAMLLRCCTKSADQPQPVEEASIFQCNAPLPLLVARTILSPILESSLAPKPFWASW